MRFWTSAGPTGKRTRFRAFRHMPSSAAESELGRRVGVLSEVIIAGCAWRVRLLRVVAGT